MKPVDYVILILTVPVAVLILVATISPLFTGRAISDSKAQLLGGIVESVIAIVLVYVGFKLRSANE